MAKTLFENIFPPVSKKEWLEKIENDLHGKSYDSLKYEVSPGIVADPLYTIEDMDEAKREQHIRAAGKRQDNRWLIRQTLTNPNKKEIGLAIDAGVDSIVVDATSITKKSFSDRFVVKCYSLEEVETVRSYNPYFKITIDPVGGWLIGKTEAVRMDLIECKPQVLRVSGNVQHEAGATAEQELAGILAWLSEYLQYLGECGKLQDFAEEIEIQTAVGIDFFPEIAKLRAVRLLVNRLLEVYEVKMPVVITGKTSQYYLGHKDPYTNLLRNTTMGLSAVIAGVNVLEIRPHTLFPDTLSLRLARNIQHLLKEETLMTRVPDMAGGNYLVEELTIQLAENAWEHFKRIEKKGGWIKQVSDETVKNILVKTHRERVEKKKAEHAVMVGINKFGNPEKEDYKQRRHKPLSELPHVIIQQQLSFDLDT